jgi:SAM-dependent methyltransferase
VIDFAGRERLRMPSAEKDPIRPSEPAGGGRPFFHETQERMALLPNYYRWIASRFRGQISGTVLELGCGAGFVLRNYADRVERVIAVDLDQGLLDRLGREWPPERVRTLRVDLDGDWREMADVRADAIVALDVLEHFENDAAFVEKLKRLLRPGGKVVLKVPAQSQLYGEVDRASGHFRRYDAGGLRALMEKQGFRTLSLRHMNPAGAWGYRLKRRRRSSYSQTFSPGKLKVVNALIPALALLDGLPGLKGLSLIGVFELAEKERAGDSGAS